MTIAKCIFVLFIVGIPVSLAGTRANPQDCIKGCLIEIEGLRDTYSRGALVEVKIRNQSKQRLDVNVAVEGLEAGSWMEIVGSVSDPRHSLSKMLILSAIKTGASMALAFDPCETPIIIKIGDSLGMSDHPCARPTTGAEMPTLLRLRVDVHIKSHEGIAQRVRSHEFRLISD